MRFLATLVVCAPLLAQSFQIVPSTATPGGSGSLLVTLSSPTDEEPVALQWKIALGTEVIAAAADIVSGDAATKAGKAVTCAPASKDTPVNSFNCVLVGGVQNISNGTIFRVKYQIKPTAAPQTLAIGISGGLAVSQHENKLRQIAIPPVKGTITVR
jgi:hypothetical protein